MDSKAVIKTVVAGALAGAAAAGTPYLQDQPVDLASVIVTVLSAVIAFLSKSPRQSS